MCWKLTKDIYNSHGLPYMVSEYLKCMGVKSVGCLDITSGSHGISFYANEDEMEVILNNNNHETYSHKLYFSKMEYKGKYYCNCVKNNSAN